MKSRFVLLLVLLSLVALSAGEPALAQCALCKQAVAASAEAEAASRGLNLAILVLLAPPVAIFAGIFGLFYRYRNHHEEE